MKKYSVIEVRIKNFGKPKVSFNTCNSYNEAVNAFNSAISEEWFNDDKEGYSVNYAPPLSLPYYEKYNTDSPALDYFKCSIKEI